MNKNDGEYVGELTVKEVINQYRYRILIHETYAGLAVDDPYRYLQFGNYAFHMWAINGYKWGIYYLKGGKKVVRFGVVINPILRFFMRRR